jgi:2-polyprenyl-6-methoxyphenol hydroxylase-like FAD-dependent oxidoreductase
MNTSRAECVVVGGGPAGMMLGYLLARAGVDVLVLEKHLDFFRDFRGDTIHPATTDVMAELGLLDDFLALPHTEVGQLELGVEGATYAIVDFRHLPTRCKFMAFMPQWDFLDFLSRKAEAYPTFHLEMGCEARDLVRRDGRVVGVRADGPSGEAEIEARLVVACDGRFSTLRDRSGLPLQRFPMPIDVLWFRLPRHEDAPHTLGYLGGGQIVLAIDRGDYWQCGTIIRKGSLPDLQAGGLDRFRRGIAKAAPFLEVELPALTDWGQVHHLDVRADRLRRWHLPGLLCIGDAAHAMSPVGAAGINYAIADAVAAANAIAEPLRRGTLEEADLAAVQERRETATRRIQVLQRAQTANLVRLAGSSRPPVPTLRLLSSCPPVKRLLGRLIGLGLRREHVRSPAAVPSQETVV